MMCQKESAKEKFPTDALNLPASGTAKEEAAQEAPDCLAKYFSVVWCKASKKKHKKWEGDAILITKGKSVILKDMEGKNIGRGTGYKAKELDSLDEGQTLMIGGKEIEVMGLISPDDFSSGRVSGRFGAILADEMGLGKTLQCIALVWTLLRQGAYGCKPVLKRALIVTPGSLVKNWKKEFQKWLGSERIKVFTVDQDHKVEEFTGSPLYSVMIISYEMLLRSLDQIQAVEFNILICDEGHRLKNSTIKTTTALTSLSCEKRIILTGTPIQNDLQEFYALIEFVNPGILGSLSTYRKIYEEPIVRSREPSATKEKSSDPMSEGHDESSLYEGVIDVFPQGYTSDTFSETDSGKLQRQQIVDSFNSKFSPAFVFLLSSKAGGVGLNLVGASHLILYDIDWNPATDIQAMARVWRDGQKHTVHIYRLLTTGTIEEKIYQRQISKQDLSGAVVDLSKTSEHIHFSIEELKNLFTLHENSSCVTHDLLECNCMGKIDQQKNEEVDDAEEQVSGGVDTWTSRWSEIWLLDSLPVMSAVKYYIA
ncbi:hypothetical protein WISP_92066 [Willisornis vidua]|uniref:DNA repair and recombination protein RAD54B n=1 Tax=Willisornis vidua TaxID=1566151 RepID=A0ABQ9D455_9PASS|nr:hypothetical protein WISP_92066 [Willisornis vidua]